MAYEFPKGPGAKGFSRQYWLDNYDAPETMDGIFNAKEYAQATRQLFVDERIHVSQLVALGFGLGHLFREMLVAFHPYEAVGIEPSAHAFHSVKPAQLRAGLHTQLTLEQTDLVSWCDLPPPQEPFDLGLCSSVFQYLADEEIEMALPVMARRIKYLFFSVPTDIELAFQAKHLDLDDTYAFSRPKERYLEWLSDHFTIVSRRILESKVHFNLRNSPFNDDLFRL